MLMRAACRRPRGQQSSSSSSGGISENSKATQRMSTFDFDRHDRSYGLSFVTQHRRCRAARDAIPTRVQSQNSPARALQVDTTLTTRNGSFSPRQPSSTSRAPEKPPPSETWLFAVPSGLASLVWHARKPPTFDERLRSSHTLKGQACGEISYFPVWIPSKK